MTDNNGVPTPPEPYGQTPPPPPYTQPTSAQPSYTPGSAYAGQPSAEPGKVLGIVGFVLAFVFSPAGIVVSAIAIAQSRRAKRKNGLALAGLILSIVFFILGVLVIILIAVAAVAVVNHECAQLGSGVHTLQNGTTFTCPSR